MENKKQESIQIIRIIAMIMILADHIALVLDVPFKSFFAQLTNSGLFIFVFLSAYLNSKKQVDNWGKWFIKKCKRIMIPFWIFIVIDFALEAIVWKEFNLKIFIAHIFGVQGFVGFQVTNMNLWYITLILLLFLFTPLLQWLCTKTRLTITLYFIILAIAQVVLSYLTDWGILGHPLGWCVIALIVYSAGYLLGRKDALEKVTLKSFIACSLIVVVAAAGAIVGRKFLDGTVAYDWIIQPYSLLVIDAWICMLMCLISKIRFPANVHKLIDFLDEISYEVYIVHGLIIYMVASPYILPHGVAWYVLATLVLTIIGAYVLNRAAKIINDKCK